MQFVSLGWQNQMGVIGGGRLGDSTALTTAHAEALFPDAVRSGAQLHVPTALRVPLPADWVETPANTVPLFPAFVDECAAWYRALLPQGQAVNLNTYSNDLTNAGYVKTGCTATLELGGLQHGADWRGAELVTNGGFDADSDWTKGSTWTISGGRANANGSGVSSLVQNVNASGLADLEFELVSWGPADNENLIVYFGPNSTGLADIPSVGPKRIDFDKSAGVLPGVKTATLEVSGPYLKFITSRTISVGNWFGGSIDNVRVFPRDFHSRVTATAANATVTKTLTRASALRGTKVIGKATGVVRASQGDVTGAELQTNHDFATNDLTGWGDGSVGTGSIDASTGDAVLTSVDGSNAARLNGEFSAEVGKFYKITAFLPSNNINFSPITGLSGGSSNLSSGVSITRLATTAEPTFRLVVPGNSGTRTLQSVSIKEVAETTVPTTFTELDLAPYTGASPRLAFRFDDGAILELYDWTHEELAADTPMFRNFRPIAEVSETVGPFSSGNTISPPATINVSALVQAPPAGARDYVVATWYTAADTNVRLQVLFNAGDLILRRNASTDVTIASAIAAGDTCLVDVEWTATDIRGRLNLGAWATLTHAAIPAFDRMRIGSDHTPANHLSAPFVALWDRDGTLGLARDGFNHGAVTCWTTGYLASVGELVWRRAGTTHALRDQHSNILK